MAGVPDLQKQILNQRLVATLERTKSQNQAIIPTTIEEKIEKLQNDMEYSKVVGAFIKRNLFLKCVLILKAESKAKSKAESKAVGKGVQKQRKPSPLGQHCTTAANLLKQKTTLVAIPQPLPLPALESKKTRLVPYTL
jgi:hypothetical protein